MQSISAKVNGEPCCDWVGDSGAGHFVKMVHNGIEYGDMQLICEAYHLMKDALGLDNQEMSDARQRFQLYPLFVGYGRCLLIFVFPDHGGMEPRRIGLLSHRHHNQHPQIQRRGRNVLG